MGTNDLHSETHYVITNCDYYWDRNKSKRIGKAAKSCLDVVAISVASALIALVIEKWLAEITIETTARSIMIQSFSSQVCSIKQNFQVQYSNAINLKLFRCFIYTGANERKRRTNHNNTEQVMLCAIVLLKTHASIALHLCTWWHNVGNYYLTIRWIIQIKQALEFHVFSCHGHGTENVMLHIIRIN